MARDEHGRFTEPEGGPASGKPASGRPPEPYEPGNFAALKAGVHSLRLVDPLAQSLAEALLDARPDLTHHLHAVAAWARAEARCLLIAEYHRKVGLINEPKGTVHLGAETARFERLAAQLRQQLGLDPRAEAELMRARREAVDPGETLRAILDHGRSVIAERAAIEGES